MRHPCTRPSARHAHDLRFLQDEAEVSEGEEASTDEDYDEEGEDDLEDGALLCGWCWLMPTASL